MNESMFRGKIKGSETGHKELDWAFGNLVTELSTGRAFIVDLGKLSQEAKFMDVAIEVIPETVGRFVGRPDKYGKRIFTGDFLGIPGSKKQGLPAEVWFNERTAVFEMRRIGYSSIPLNGVEYWGEVIGNIWDNKEMTEEGK